ncbi:MAG: hypothetical protein GOVbin3250_29 [Prokaryotic dsDNA virus sp.]|nr:MAG: hypothetical protein GOVbin3250_29 [Prokaryotic dsDNA virus sp.]|tara:strand:+ start:15104 stop:15295 length:192 start_codon:yes stop_codon:yes gene_type:complete
MKNKQSQSASQSEAEEIMDEEIKRLESELCKAISTLDTAKINRLTMQIEILEYIKLKINIKIC